MLNVSSGFRQPVTARASHPTYVYSIVVYLCSSICIAQWVHSDFITSDFISYWVTWLLQDKEKSLLPLDINSFNSNQLINNNIKPVDLMKPNETSV